MNTCSEVKRIELSFPSELGYEVIARDVIASFAHYNGFHAERIEDIKTALGEACINAIEHGNSLLSHLRTDITCMYDGQKLQIDVCDQGVRLFVPETEPLTIDEKLAGLGPLRGMGLLLIHQLADETSFSAKANSGNCFRLVWYQNQQEHPGV
jgi:serine/threonine-protein kinase RsbW